MALEVGLEPNPWAEFAGMFKDDPMIDEWKSAMADYRKKVEDDPEGMVQNWFVCGNNATAPPRHMRHGLSSSFADLGAYFQRAYRRFYVGEADLRMVVGVVMSGDKLLIQLD